MKIKFMEELKDINNMVKGGMAYTNAIKEKLGSDVKSWEVKMLRALSIDYYG